ncbi:hypothetical protein [Fontivita pretiosa]|uniref:hypothetical protein n=1 Tax=Fontivita pretiosa TaxID=2989684 RepID=UPI003D1767A7
MGVLLCLLWAIIGAYWFITDSRRVRQMAQTYLTQLVGGPVTVGDATLSIFEGLRLDKVRVYVDSSPGPDSLLFSAQSLLIQYDPRALISGRLEATRIVAVDPRVHVMEDAESGRRNYARLMERRAASPPPLNSPARRIELPEIVLRNAQVDYARVARGAVVERSSIGIEGLLSPVPESKVYNFAFQSRGPSAGIGPMVSGSIAMGSGELTASLYNFEFGPDVKAMLPPEVRKWWEQHGLAGRVDIPKLYYRPPITGKQQTEYRVEIELRSVTLAVRPEEWMGADEDRVLRDLHDAFGAMRLAGLDRRGFIDHVARLVEPQPIVLKRVHGRFVFDDDQTIQIDDLNGWLEGFPFKVSGTIRGYTPAAVAHVRIETADFQNIEIPAAPRYLNSLPPAVREIYDHFKPRGICRFWVDVDRPTPGARPRVSGEIEIVDGNFCFQKFPYPLRQTTGRIILSHDPQTGVESLKLDRIRGRGVAGGPNADRFVEINGTIGPFGPDARVDIIVSGQQVSNEPALIAAFPPLTQKALKLFDAPGRGEYPRFSGDFVCTVIRLAGPESHWIIDTNIQLDDASGSLVGFPYFMSGVNGLLKIRDDHVELVNVNMSRGDATLRIDGRVSWPGERAAPGAQRSGPTLYPDLRISARNVPIDRALLEALPAARRAWIQKLGVGGRFDLEGTIRPARRAADNSAAAIQGSPTASTARAAEQPFTPSDESAVDLDYDLRIALHDGTLWPTDGTFAVSEVQANLRLTNQKLTINDVRGKRGQATITARGEIAWPNEIPRLVLQASASDLVLDPALYKLLPRQAQQAWDQVRPQGTLDVAVAYSGTVSEALNPQISQSPAPPPRSGGYEIVLTPRRLSATPAALPYRLDQLAGTVTVHPDRVTLTDLTARHGDAKIRISGTGAAAPARSQSPHAQQQELIWEFTLAGQNVALDDELRRALPGTLAELLASMQFQGTVNLEFSKLRIAPPSQQTTAPAAPLESTTRGAETAAGPLALADIDFAATLETASAAVDVGVPLADVRGKLELNGSARNGRLSELSGRIDMESLTLAGRTMSDLHAVLIKSADRDQLTLGRIEAKLAGGSMAGQVDYAFPEAGPSRYAVNLILRDADVRELAGETEPDIQGQLSASLALEGTYAQPQSRRGRGDVSVVGRQMYRIPLVLGLLQITNLSLPITSPFTQASTRYSIDGARVTFEQIELRSREMLMQGDGSIDFDSRKVRLKFVTDSTSWLKLPLIGELLTGARHELLQIQVRGTIQEPRVRARSMNTLTTTVDEVFRGQGPPTTRDK